jgi:hypothetical protein
MHYSITPRDGVRLFAMRSARSTIAAISLAALSVSPTFVSADDSLKQALATLSNISTATWRVSYFRRFSNNDGTSTIWVRVPNNDQRISYEAPVSYRRETLDDDGVVRHVLIQQLHNRFELVLDPTRHTAQYRYLVDSDLSRPFALYMGLMTRPDLQQLGHETNAGLDLVGYRHAFFATSQNQRWSYEFWLNEKNNQLFRAQIPGGDIFRLHDIADWEGTGVPARVSINGRHYERAGVGIGRAGHLVTNIAINPTLNGDLFSLDSPPGYTVTVAHLPEITEADIAKFLRIVAEYFGGIFPNSITTFNSGSEYDRFENIEQDVVAKRTHVQQHINMVEEMHRWWNAGIPGPGPIHAFIHTHTHPGSWKYTGAGISLGDRDRIVCLYRLKTTDAYRAIFGDLTIRTIPLAPIGKARSQPACSRSRRYD